MSQKGRIIFSSSTRGRHRTPSMPSHLCQTCCSCCLSISLTLAICLSVRWWRMRTPTWMRWILNPTPSSSFSSDTRSEHAVQNPSVHVQKCVCTLMTWWRILFYLFFFAAARSWGWTSTSRWRQSRNRSRRRLTRTSRRTGSSSSRCGPLPHL